MSKSAKNKEALPPLTDELIDSGADLSAYLQNARPAPALNEPQKVNVDFPAWVVAALDREAERIGVPRQSLIKVWIVEQLERRDRPAEPSIVISDELNKVIAQMRSKQSRRHSKPSRRTSAGFSLPA